MAATIAIRQAWPLLSNCRSRSDTSSSDALGNNRFGDRQFFSYDAIPTSPRLSGKRTASLPISFDVFTLGFSNRSWEETIRILRAFAIERLVDIRTLPGSRRTPQFNLEHLSRALPRSGIDYIHLKSLGGFRKPKLSDSRNEGWKNDGFRGYADYMQTAEFREALDELIRLSSASRAIYACTEAVFWRCHRALVSDALLVRGHKVGHVFSETKCEPHQLTSFAHVEGELITYPARR